MGSLLNAAALPSLLNAKNCVNYRVSCCVSLCGSLCVSLRFTTLHSVSVFLHDVSLGMQKDYIVGPLSRKSVHLLGPEWPQN